MPRQNQQADLVKTLADTDARLRKLERQMTVPRTEYSFVAASETSTAVAVPAALATADSVTVTCLASSIVQLFVQVTLKNSSALGSSTVYLRDETAAMDYQVIAANGTTVQTQSSAPGDVNGSIPGGWLALFVSTDGPRTFSLRYSVSSATTGTFSNRILAASAPTRRLIN